MPRIHASTKTAVPTPCVSATAMAGMALAIEPKIGTSENTAETSAMTGQYFRPTIMKPSAERTPLIPQMTSCPRTTPERPLSMRPRSESKLSRRAGRTSDRKKSDDALARQHRVGGEHQRDEEDEDRAAHAGDEVPDRPGHFERVLLRVSERTTHDVAHDPVEVEGRLLLGVRRLDVPAAVRVDDAHARADVDGDRAIRLGARHERAGRSFLGGLLGRGLRGGQSHGAEAACDGRDPACRRLLRHLRDLVPEIAELVGDARRDRPRERTERAEDGRIDAEDRQDTRHLAAFERRDQWRQHVRDHDREDEREHHLPCRDHGRDGDRCAHPEKQRSPPAGWGRRRTTRCLRPRRRSSRC